MTDIIDTAIVEELRELMEDDFEVLLTTFISDSETKFTGLAAAVASGVGEDIRRAAHSLKGSSSNLGATQLSDLCFQLEKMGRENNLDGAQNILQQLELSLLETTTYFKSLILPR